MNDLLIDGNSLYARAWYATLKEGPGAAIPATLNTLMSLLDTSNDRLGGDRIDRMLFAWDGAATRDKHREPKPEAYYETLLLLIDHLNLLFGAAHAINDSYEADDLVATAAYQSKADQIFVVSGDKDLQQLAGRRVHYYSLNDKVILSCRSICDRWHVKQPSQVAIALAIIGDKIDLVAGIKGWGPKKVKRLFEAVTPEMNFEQALDNILSQMPEEVQAQFLADLDLTMLNPLIEGVPEPKQIVPAQLAVVEALNMPNLTAIYRPFYHRYTSRLTSEDGDSEDVPDDY
jgi:5'-3' exonuclease